MSARKPSAREEQLERENRLLREQIARMRSEPDDIPDIGCGDNSCVVRRSRGMATNGGCLCDERMLRRAVQYWRRVAQFRQITIMTMRDGQPTSRPRCTCPDGDLRMAFVADDCPEHGRKGGA